MQMCHFNILFGAHHVKNVILFIFKLSKFIVFIFELFQSLELIKYVLLSKCLCHYSDVESSLGCVKNQTISS
jgi:hypothetical protein